MFGPGSVIMDRRRRVSASRGLPARIIGILVLFCRPRTAAAFSEETPPPPRDFIISQTTLTWNSTAPDVTFNVEYLGFDSAWEPVETCTNTSLTSCDFGSEQAVAEYGCLQLRVAALRNGLTSEPVEVCSREGNLCSPNFTLTAAPGSLSVNLKRNHVHVEEHGGHLKHRVYLWKNGDKDEEYTDSSSSKFFDDLDVGQQYCVKVQFLLHAKPLGPASCVQCETIPDFGESKRTQIILITVAVVGIVVFIVVAYVRLFKFKKIKEIIQPPYTIPPELLSRRSYPFQVVSPPQEHYDVISSITLEPSAV